MGCPEEPNPIDSELTFINNSDLEIAYYDELKTPNDTLLTNIAFPQTPQNTEPRTIAANSSLTAKTELKKILQNNPDKLLMIFLFSRKIIKEKPWEEIRDNNLYLERYDLSLEDLEASNWTIEYP